MLRVELLIQDDARIVGLHVAVEQLDVVSGDVADTGLAAVQSANAHAVHTVRNGELHLRKLRGHAYAPVVTDNEQRVPNLIQRPLHQGRAVAQERWHPVPVHRTDLDRRLLGPYAVQALDLLRDDRLCNLCVAATAQVDAVFTRQRLTELYLLVQCVGQERCAHQIVDAIPAHDRHLRAAEVLVRREGEVLHAGCV